MPRKFVKYLQGNNIYICHKCKSHLTSFSDLISTAFTARSGQAFLFNQVINIKLQQPETKQLRTGLHKTAELYCNVCDDKHPIGWKYLWAEQQSQKYKENRYILEKAYISREQWIDN